MLCYAEANIDRNLKTEDIKNYYLSFNGENTGVLSSEELAEGIAINFESKNISLQLKQTISKMELSLLIEQSPGRLHYKDLINEVSERLITDQSLIEKQLNNDINFMRLVLGGMININLSPADFILEITDQPETTALVRHQASKKNRMTNQLHQSIAVNLFERSILLQMDGKTNISDMVNKVLVQSENKQSNSEVESLCQQALIRFSQQTLFI